MPQNSSKFMMENGANLEFFNLAAMSSINFKDFLFNRYYSSLKGSAYLRGQGKLRFNIHTNECGEHCNSGSVFQVGTPAHEGPAGCAQVKAWCLQDSGCVGAMESVATATSVGN
jgi:hypothetical protein